MKLYEEFKLYENMWKAEAHALTESITTHFCNSCKQTVQLDDNAMCPNCADGISYLTDLVAEVLSEDSKLYIIYNTDKESINKADLNLATGHINKGAKVVQVTKEFFSQLKPVVHSATPEDSGCGKVVLNDEPKIIQLILAELEHYTSILENDLGKSAKQAKRTTSSSNNSVTGQQKINFGEEFELNEDSSAEAYTPLLWKNREGVEIDLNDPVAIQQELDTHRQRYIDWLKKEFQKEPPKQTVRNGKIVSKKFSTLQGLIHQAKRNDRSFADELRAVIDREVKRYKAELDEIKVKVANGNTSVKALKFKESANVHLKGVKNMKLHEEFKFVETMWDADSDNIDKVSADTRTVPDVAYVVKFDDGINYEDVYLTFSDEVDDYTSVDYIDEVGEWDYHTSVEDALARARDFGWTSANLRIVKVNNFKDAYLNGADPEEELAQVVAEKVLKTRKNNELLTEGDSEETLTESRSSADIEAEIAKLQLELSQAIENEKRAASKGTKSVWVFDIYRDLSDKGYGTSDMVYETETAAINAGWNHLSELDNEEELEYDEDDYTVAAIEIPLARVSEDTLSFSGLDHLWDPVAGANRQVSLCGSCHNELAYEATELKTGFHCPYCGTFLHK